MSIHGQAKLLTLYIGEGENWKGKPLYLALIIKLKEHGIAGATASRGILGYGAMKQLHFAKILDLSADLPMIVQAVDAEEKISKVLPVIQEMVNRGLITVSDVQVVSKEKK
ncbi:MAG: DUF190 domain-containing protein [Bacillota bacterium]